MTALLKTALILAILYGWLFLALVLGGLCAYLIFRVIADKKRDERQLGRLLLLPIALCAFAYVTWPHLLGRAIYEVRCHINSGLSVNTTVSASETGYFLYDAFDTKKSGRGFSSHPYAHQAVADLLSGRIRFFEGSASFGGAEVEFPYLRIWLADRNNRACENAEGLLLGLRLPDGVCIATEKIRTLESRYEVQVYRTVGRNDLESVRLVDRVSGDTLTQFNRYALSSRLSCPVNSQVRHSPIWAITTTALKDANGGVWTEADFNALTKRIPESQLSSIREIPPRALDSQQLATKPSKCLASALGSTYETHRVSLSGGSGREVPVQLDSSSNKVREVRVLVNNPAKNTVVYLESYDPVVWSISRTPESHIAGVVVKGYHGQAVLGVERKTPVMIASDTYSPGSNCSLSEIGSMYDALTKQATRIQGRTESAVVIGNPDFHESSLLEFSDRKLEDYAFR